MDDKWKWLESTLQLQRAAFDIDPPALEDAELADYIVWNVTALTAELGEFLMEVGWKPWAEPRGWVRRKEAVNELVDVAHFLANLAVALGVTDVEWAKLYQEKQGVNARRQAETYDGVSGKCSDCHRDLATVTLYNIEDMDGTKRQACPCGKVLA